jgi:hypothetical protein
VFESRTEPSSKLEEQNTFLETKGGSMQIDTLGALFEATALDVAGSERTLHSAVRFLIPAFVEALS